MKQEVAASEQSVLSVVLSSDIERTNLLQREKELIRLQESAASSNAAVLQKIMDELAELHERMTIIGVDSAERWESLYLTPRF